MTVRVCKMDGEVMRKYHGRRCFPLAVKRHHDQDSLVRKMFVRAHSRRGLEPMTFMAGSSMAQAGLVLEQ